MSCVPKVSNILLGLGVLNFMLGRMVRFSRDTTAFIMLVIAAAPSPWPRFGLVYRVLSNLFTQKGGFRRTAPKYTPFSPKHLPIASASMGSPCLVPVPKIILYLVLFHRQVPYAHKGESHSEELLLTMCLDHCRFRQIQSCRAVSLANQSFVCIAIWHSHSVGSTITKYRIVSGVFSWLFI